jgi:hypothetical protein
VLDFLGGQVTEENLADKVWILAMQILQYKLNIFLPQVCLEQGEPLDHRGHLVFVNIATMPTPSRHRDKTETPRDLE